MTNRIVYLCFLAEFLGGVGITTYGQYADVHWFLWTGGTLSGMAAGAAVTRYILFDMFKLNNKKRD